jgi:hypothetical protein
MQLRLGFQTRKYRVIEKCSVAVALPAGRGSSAFSAECSITYLKQHVLDIHGARSYVMLFIVKCSTQDYFIIHVNTSDILSAMQYDNN